ncbi:Induced myeloid leukemia cell differentiation protein Mcl-1 [Orchesella cincta]|uniref:Induced myeloid leukemia cell differentiation protein Mcl-1 n=1 Tax=Orchesella cincta TaxID=48709 RepID=A0A1D2NLV1_ORCCI|nr:Induced myeloid leukemia cell differentiation protein Mcl-1 [Orchesella cincta]
MPLSSSSVSSSGVDNNNVREHMDQELQNGGDDVYDEVDGSDIGRRRAVSDSTQTEEYDTVDSRTCIVGRVPIRNGESSNNCIQEGGLLSNLITLVLPARRKTNSEEGNDEHSALVQPLAVNNRSISTQTEESPASIRAYELCCMVIQELVLENPVPQSARDHVFDALCCCVCEILDKHVILFNGMLRRFEVTDYGVFASIANELFEANSENVFNVTWGRVVSLFAFAVRLAQKHKEAHDDDKIDHVVHYLSDYISRQLLDFVVNNGGWEGLVKQFPLPDTEEKQVKRAMLWSGLCVGLVATMYVSSFLSK